MSKKSKEKTLERFNRNKGQKKPHKKHPKLRLAMKISLLLFLLLVLAGMLVFYVKFGDDLIKWKAEAKEAVKASTTDTFRSSETSFIYASNKKPIAKLVQERDSYYLTFDEIPQYVKDCFIVTEDREFYGHDGVNFLSTVKAAALLVESRLKGSKEITRGGSTIKKQLTMAMENMELRQQAEPILASPLQNWIYRKLRSCAQRQTVLIITIRWTKRDLPI